MRVLVHLSDLHFGRVDQRLLAPLTARVNRLAPDLVAVSGDLTQRAKSAQFIAARAWLDTLEAPRLVVPGNHDISLYNLVNRFLRPLDKYRRYIDANPEPEHVDAQVAVIGINSARSLTFKNGRINEGQLARLRERLAPLPPGLLKVVVTHHPFSGPMDADADSLIGRADTAMQVFRELGVDLLLAGHMHSSHATHTGERYPLPGYAALVVQAGTATSTRGRGESNSFNVLRLDGGASGGSRVEIERHGWDEQAQDFRLEEQHQFVRGGLGWQTLR